MTGSGTVPAAAALAALAGLPGMGPRRLAVLLMAWDPPEAWRRVASGSVEASVLALGGARVGADVLVRWRLEAACVDLDVLWRRHLDAGVGVSGPGDLGFPAALADDPEPPALLFHQGDPGVLDRPRVAVVGTRRCTHTGRQVARELGADLAAAGVCVVSGLALGIDGAAHVGALEAGGAPPVAVVATGLDIAYPRRHASLWAEVAAAGAVLSEYPLGTTVEPWRFPARNRIIAGLADVVVVVESPARGGSMHTVEAALARDRAVMAVPGSVRSPASVGTNGLLSSGATPARDAADVLVALGMASRAPVRDRPDPPGGDAGAVLDALGGDPATMEQLAGRLDVPLGPLAVHLAALESSGWVVRHGAWYERSQPG
ncbi:MAG TPA: DNA-processing protein DprA [Acidimicrobiales bacterium]|nr:DNA-processing protein DprA [Acidimicrobiales bacterium]